jgi:EmrB/QacA subfamily drug resistance transporter
MTTTTIARPAARDDQRAHATRALRPTAILTVLLGAQLMAILDVNIVNVAAATIQTDLHASGASLQLIIAGYLIAYAVLLITGARLGGLLGYRRTFLVGLGAFTAASLACGLAGSGGSLTAFRFLQGAGAALMIPQVFSLIQRHFEGPARARALGRYAAVIAGGVVAGQILGGVLVDANLWNTGWRPIFFINVPIGIALLVAGVRLLPRDAAEPGRRLDVPGLIALAAAVLAFVLPLVFGHQQGWPLWTWLSLGGSVVLFAAFAFVQSRVQHPLMPGRLFRVRGLVVAAATMFVMMVAYGGYLFSVALHLQAGLGYSPLHAGLTFVPMALSFGTASLNWRRLPARWHRVMIPVGLAVAAASLAVIAAVLHASATPNLWFFLAQVPFGLGAGVAFSPLMAQALAGVAPADASDASGVVTTTVQLAQVVGLAGIGSLYLSLVGSHGSTAAVTVAVASAGVACLIAVGLSALMPRAR